jgi:hypothetical protein
LQETAHLPLPEQGEALHRFLMEWKGDYEQVDDVLVIGLKPLRR